MGDRERSDLREAPPLVVDLDGTLITRDLLRECLSRLGRARPWWVPLLPVYLVRGRAAFKAKVAHLVVIAPARLPYRRQVLEFLRAEPARGRRLILATAAQRRSAEAVARHLGLFEAVIAGDHTHTPKGVEKLAAIRAVVGGVFDYMGDARADLPIFQAARLAILVHPSTRLLTRARASCRVGHVFD